MKDKQLQYEGSLQTPQLWKGIIFDLEQIELPKIHTLKLKQSVLQKRLGHRVEQFVFQEINTIDTCKIIAKNIQIIENKITIGELDCILTQNDTPIHLEIVYKFYLHDKTVGTTEIKHWIGPNRKDSLVEKLTKLKEKQLPLLQHKATQTALQKNKIDTCNIKQQVYFKAQLFVPKKLLTQIFTVVNNACITGFYISFLEVSILKNNTFYIPSKLDWLVTPHQNVQWIAFDQFIQEITVFIESKRSPMCWLKDNNGVLQKFFVVWW